MNMGFSFLPPSTFHPILDYMWQRNAPLTEQWAQSRPWGGVAGVADFRPRTRAEGDVVDDTELEWMGESKCPGKEKKRLHSKAGTEGASGWLLTLPVASGPVVGGWWASKGGWRMEDGGGRGFEALILTLTGPRGPSGTDTLFPSG